MITYDSQRTIDASGAFLIGELERLDPEINLPLVGTTYTRDIQFREDVNIADEISSFTKTGFGVAGNPVQPFAESEPTVRLFYLGRESLRKGSHRTDNSTKATENQVTASKLRCSSFA